MGESTGSGAQGKPRWPSPCPLRAEATGRCEQGGSRRERYSAPCCRPSPSLGPCGGPGWGSYSGGLTDSPAPAGTPPNPIQEPPAQPRPPHPGQDPAAVLCVWALSPENSSSSPLPGPRRDSELAGRVQVVRELAPRHSQSWAHRGWPVGSVGGFGVRRLLGTGCRHVVGGGLRTGLAGTAPTDLQEPWTPPAGWQWREEGLGQDPAEAIASPECPHHSMAMPSTVLPLAPGRARASLEAVASCSLTRRLAGDGWRVRHPEGAEWGHRTHEPTSAFPVTPHGQRGSLGPEGPGASVSWSGTLCPALTPRAPGWRLGPQAARGLGRRGGTWAPGGQLAPPPPAQSPQCVLPACQPGARRAPLPWVGPPALPRPAPPHSPLCLGLLPDTSTRAPRCPLCLRQRDLCSLEPGTTEACAARIAPGLWAPEERGLQGGGQPGAGGAAPTFPAQAAGPSWRGQLSLRGGRTQEPRCSVWQEHSGREVAGVGRGQQTADPGAAPPDRASLFPSVKWGDRETSSGSPQRASRPVPPLSSGCSPGTSRRGPGLRGAPRRAGGLSRTHSVHGTHTSPAHQHATFLHSCVSGAPLFRPKALPVAPRPLAAPGTWASRA